MLHLPLPCPDLDGECRGLPILSLLDSNAWHVLITGVKPNDDVDRGPFRSADSERNDLPTESPYGDLAISTGGAQAMSCNIEIIRSLHYPNPNIPLPQIGLNSNNRSAWSIEEIGISAARMLRAKTCVWRI